MVTVLPRGLLFGARPIGANSRRLSSGHWRAFQTSLGHTPPGDDEKKSRREAPAFAGRWKMATVVASPSHPNSMQFIAQATRSMAGSPPGSHNDGKPTLEYARKLPKTFASMTNDQILHFAELGIPEACRECIVRDVMVVDNVEYDEAMKVFNEIAKANREGMFNAALPFYVGFGTSFAAGIVSIPLVFHLPTVDWFNEACVTSELPPPEDLETFLEVGAASWGWMEPVLGQISFFLLCMQFSRAQLKNLGIRPYFYWQRERRVRYLIGKYPQYDAEFLANYSRCDRLSSPHNMDD